MTITRSIIAISRSKIFAFVLFVVSTYAGIHIISHLDSRNAIIGDKIHSVFSVIAIRENGSAAFEFVRLSELETFRDENPRASFRLPKRDGEVTDGESTIRSYLVLEEGGGEQLIEAMEKSDDYTSWSVYRSTNSTVVPVRSRILHVAYMFRSAAMSLMLVIFVQLVGKCLDVWSRRGSSDRVK